MAVRSTIRRAMVWAGLLGAAGAGIPLLRLTLLIEEQSRVDEARPADVIVVLGAAEYRGRPSPVLRSRLDHGFDLYERRLAPRIFTTGGAGGDPVHTEATVGRAYLVSKGVPSEAIIIEKEGETTVQTVAVVGEVMRRMNLRSCIAVSDGYHIFRVKKLLEARSITVYGSPRPGEAARGWRLWWQCLRQAAGYLLWLAGIGW